MTAAPNAAISSALPLAIPLPSTASILNAIDPSLLAAYAKNSEQELGVGDSVAIEMNYARVMLSDWQRLETSVRDLLSRYRVQP